MASDNFLFFGTFPATEPAVGLNGPMTIDGETHLPSDRLVEIEDVAGGQANVDDAVERRMELGEDAPSAGGLATAAVAGDEANAAHLEQMTKATIPRAMGGHGRATPRAMAATTVRSKNDVRAAR